METPTDVLTVNKVLAIPRDELVARASRSGGPGGQHVNTSSTRVELLWNVRTSSVLFDDQRTRLLEALRTRLSAIGDLRVVASDTRSQRQNRALAEKRLAEIVRRALIVKKARRLTRPTRSAVERRLAEKKLRSERKHDRRDQGEEQSGGRRFAGGIARRRAKRGGRTRQLTALDPAREVAGDRVPVRTHLIRPRSGRTRRRPRPQLHDLELRHRPDFRGGILVGGKHKQAVRQRALSGPLQRGQLRARLRGPAPRRGHELVDRLGEREGVGAMRRELHEPRRALTLKNAVDDHLRQRTRRTQLVEHGRGVGTEQLDVSEIETRWKEREQRVGDREFLRVEFRNKRRERLALVRAANRARGLLAVALERIRVFHPADRLRHGVDREAVEEIEERETILEQCERIAVAHVAQAEARHGKSAHLHLMPQEIAGRRRVVPEIRARVRGVFGTRVRVAQVEVSLPEAVGHDGLERIGLRKGYLY